MAFAIARRTFAALGNERFRLLWFGTLFSFLGMQMQIIARGYLAYDLTGKNGALGGVMLAFGVPQLVLSLWGGVIADRLPKRNVLVAAQSVIALNSAWIAAMIATGQIAYWMLIVAGVVQGVGFAFIGPARQAFISDLVGRETIGNAVVLQQMSMNGTRVIGPSLAGFFIAVPFIGLAGVYALTTVGFFIAMMTMLRLPRGDPAPGARDHSPLADLRDGLRYVRRKPAVLQLILVSFAVVMLGFPYQSFLPSVAASVYDVGSTGLGALSSAAAIGAVAATVAVATFADHPRAWHLQPVAGIAFGGALVVLGLVDRFEAGMVTMLFVGGLAAAFQSLNNSLTMMFTDHEYHGRVQSMTMMSWSLFGIAALPIGVVADHIGIRETLSLMGLACIASVILIHGYARLRHGDAIRPVAPGAPAPQTLRSQR
ncbi:Enterobactin exporter EntS [bacterium HR29]|mgnify:CR=1 FL=1|nr:Enterobactin exporter EntS [bacterium HR29]